jgi:hypothetical protein
MSSSTYLLGATLLSVGGVVAWFLGVDAEQKSLETVARPLAFVKGDASRVRPERPPRTPPSAGPRAP